VAARAHRIRLPSGLAAVVRAPASLRTDDVVGGERLVFGRAIAVLSEPGALAHDDGAPLDPMGLAMRDFHALRDLLLRTRAIAPDPDPGTCRNCEAEVPFDPTQLDPRELARREPSAALGGAFDLPEVVRLPRGAETKQATMEPVTLGEALHLLAVLAEDAPFRVTPKLLAAMGVRALGDVEKPALVARILARASDPVWSAIERRYLLVNYPPRTVAPLPCPACGAMHEVDVPQPRELDPDADARTTDEPFPDAAAFEALVEKIAPEVYRARGVKNVALRVEPGVPATDIAGEPLLGSYEPRQDVDSAGYTQLEFLVTLYYRTFRHVWEDDGPYDVEAEIRETIDHELEHHLHHLSGHDPMDAAERAEARREIRQLYGDRRLAKAAASEAGRDLAAFARTTWPFFALIALGIAVATWMGFFR
jgi:hypothetical protein